MEPYQLYHTHSPSSCQGSRRTLTSHTCTCNTHRFVLHSYTSPSPSMVIVSSSHISLCCMLPTPKSPPEKFLLQFNPPSLLRTPASEYPRPQIKAWSPCARHESITRTGGVPVSFLSPARDEASGQLHVMVALVLGKMHTVCNKREAGWALWNSLDVLERVHTSCHCWESNDSPLDVQSRT
jgi:hypothetical protein